MEDETAKERIEKGIPLHPEVTNWFKDICSELSIEINDSLGGIG